MGLFAFYLSLGWYGYVKLIYLTCLKTTEMPIWCARNKNCINYLNKKTRKHRTTQNSPCHKPLYLAICYKNVEWLQICHWQTVHPRWFKSYIFENKSILSSFGFSKIAFIIPSHIIIVPYFILWVLDFYLRHFS